MTFWNLPVETVAFAWRADNTFGVCGRRAILTGFLGVKFLSLVDCCASVDRQQFVRADATRQDFLLACFGIEPPLGVGAALNRHWKREIVGADVENLAAVGHQYPAIHLIKL